MSVALTVDEAAAFMGKKNARAVVRLARLDPSFPLNREVRPNIVLQAALQYLAEYSC